MTLSQALALWPRHEALLLLQRVTGLPRADILLRGEEALRPEPEDAYLRLIARRKRGEPLQYILGEWDFFGLPFATDGRALIPRPETELLAEAVIGFNPAKALDLCTGGGCLAVTLAKRTGAEVVAADISSAALALARENAARHGVAGRIRFAESDLFENIAESNFDCIVSNPPYIPTGEIAGLQTEVKDHEPLLALDGGADGLDIYRKLIPAALGYLRPGGALFLEIGPWAGVRALLSQAGYAAVKVTRDYSGRERVVCAVTEREKYV